MNKQCPFCDASNIIALGAVAYSTCVVVEHRCMRCGHLFYLNDRRALARSVVYFSTTVINNA